MNRRIDSNGVLVQTKFIVPGHEVRRMVGCPYSQKERGIRNSPQRLSCISRVPSSTLHLAWLTQGCERILRSLPRVSKADGSTATHPYG